MTRTNTALTVAAVVLLMMSLAGDTPFWRTVPLAGATVVLISVGVRWFRRGSTSANSSVGRRG